MRIITDSCCDLTIEYVKENNITVLPLTIILDGEEKEDDLAITKKHSEYYESMRNGAMPKTSQINAYTFQKVFEECAKINEPVIYIGFSSVLSGCVHSAQMAENEVKQTYPDAKIAVIDSRCVSMGLGLLVRYAVEKVKTGSSWEEVVGYVETNKLNINHWITVDDLKHLLRGGRLSKTAATVGILLSVKPILTVDKEGKLIPVDKVKGRKKSIKTIVSRLKEDMICGTTDTIMVGHAGCEEEAIAVKESIKQECEIDNIIVADMGAIMGAHGGPGVIAIFFMSKERQY